MPVNHADMPDADRHEPKGASTASSGEVYVSDGAGGGAWAKLLTSNLDTTGGSDKQILVADGAGGLSWQYVSMGRISFVDIGSPYTLGLTVTPQVLQPTTALSGSELEFDNGGSNNGRLRYIGTETKHMHIACTVSLDHAAGAARSFRFVIAKDGIAIPSSEVILTASSGTYASTALHADVMMSTNEYLEVYGRIQTTNTTLQLQTFYLFAMSMPGT